MKSRLLFWLLAIPFCMFFWIFVGIWAYTLFVAFTGIHP